MEAAVKLEIFKYSNIHWKLKEKNQHNESRDELTNSTAPLVAPTSSCSSAPSSVSTHRSPEEPHN